MAIEGKNKTLVTLTALILCFTKFDFCEAKFSFKNVFNKVKNVVDKIDEQVNNKTPSTNVTDNTQTPVNPDGTGSSQVIQNQNTADSNSQIRNLVGGAKNLLDKVDSSINKTGNSSPTENSGPTQTDFDNAKVEADRCEAEYKKNPTQENAKKWAAACNEVEVVGSEIYNQKKTVEAKETAESNSAKEDLKKAEDQYNAAKDSATKALRAVLENRTAAAN